MFHDINRWGFCRGIYVWFSWAQALEPPELSLTTRLRRWAWDKCHLVAVFGDWDRMDFYASGPWREVAQRRASD